MKRYFLKTVNIKTLNVARDRAVIVVDDDKPTRYLISEILKRKDISVKEFETGEEAFDYFRECKDLVDLILIDLHLPGMDGYELLSLVRELKADIPAIAITTDSFLTYPNEALGEKFNSVVKKPITLNELADLVESLMPLSSGDLNYLNQNIIEQEGQF